jgi:arylsulfatase A-like enzyme
VSRRLPISRRGFLKAAALGTVATVVKPARAQGSRSQPDLLVIVADDLRSDVLGCAGDANARTPHLDALAARGARFRNDFVTTSICASSRASLLTGQWASRHGVWSFEEGLAPAQLEGTYPAQLRAAGYHTGFVGKFGIGTGWPDGAPLPFDDWQGFFGQGSYWQDEKGQGEHLTDRIRAEAVGFLARAPARRPFCLSVSFKAPHAQDEDEATDPFQPQPRFLALFTDTVFPRPATATPSHFERLPVWLRESEARRRWQTRFSDDARFQDSLRRYYALVAGLDAAVGEILAALARLGRDRSTIVVFTSDNGFFLGEHGLAGKWFGFEESIRTPLLVAGPGVRAGADVHAATLNVDLAPTLLELAGAAIPGGVQGRSLVPLLRGETPSPPWRVDWLYEHRLVLPDADPTGAGLRPISRSEGIRTERYKYLVHYDEPEPNTLLFDLEQDPHEEQDLSSRAPADLRERLSAQLAQLRAQVEAPPTGVR